MAQKIQDGRHEIKFFDISTSDGGDLPRIIEIALFFFLFIYFFLITRYGPGIGFVYWSISRYK